MPTAASTPFCDIAPRGHRPLIGREPRVIFTSCTVDPSTLAVLNGWAGSFVISRGVLLDKLAAFAVKRGFVRAYEAEQKKKRPIRASLSDGHSAHRSTKAKK